MKQSRVVVLWREGLHLQHAVELVCLASRFRSSIFLKYREKVADLHNILSVVALCATMGTALTLETKGEDEQAAAQAVQQAFLSLDGKDSFESSPPR